jgi:hypothetical protein
MSQEDPGWWPSLRGLWWYLIPILGEVMRARWWRKETNGLIAIRGRFLGFLVSLFLFVFAMSFIAPWDGGDERWVPWAVAALGVYSLAAMAWIHRRPLVTGSPEALAGSYRARFFIGVGLAQSAALFGLAGVFIGGSLLDLSCRSGLRARRVLDDRPHSPGYRTKATRDHRGWVTDLASGCPHCRSNAIERHGSHEHADNESNLGRVGNARRSLGVDRDSRKQRRGALEDPDWAVCGVAIPQLPAPVPGH